MRYSLLMTAVATVTVPGLLAVAGVVGHDHPAVRIDAAAAALNGTTLSGPFPVAPATAHAAVRNDVATMQRAAGLTVTVLRRVTASQQALGLRLLGQAADAGLTASYTGTEQIAQPGLKGTVEVVSRVRHQGESLTLTQPADATAANGVFGVTRSLVALLGKHYVAVYRGGGSAVSRNAAVVELYRFDGSLAARYWLDRQTMVPLRRELFDTSDRVISEDSFVQVQFGSSAPAQPAGLSASAVPAQAAWATTAAPARFLASLTGQGWSVPGALPGGLPLYAAARDQTSSGEVVDLEYSDGLYVVSLFVQRGTLVPPLAGWQQVRVAGQRAFVSGHSVTWAGTGFVYTMIADAPPRTVTQVVQALPLSGPPGLLSRLGRGLERLVRLANPFG